MTLEHRAKSAWSAGDLGIILWLLLAGVACGSVVPTEPRGPVELTIGFGLATTETPDYGMQAAASVIAFEGLAKFDENGRPQPALAQSWTGAADGLSWRIQLRPSVQFHGGKLLDARTVANVLRTSLPKYMGPAGADISEIRVDGERDLTIRLNRRSAFVPEALEGDIQDPDHPNLGTGPFRIASSASDSLEMDANQQYYLGAPHIDRIRIKSYPNLRAAWAELMRGQVDVLYDIGTDALDLLAPASNVHVFEFRQRYAYIVLLNVRRPQLRNQRIRYALNTALDRPKLIADALHGHGVPAVGPVWPEHWAINRALPVFQYDPAAAAKVFSSRGDPRNRRDVQGHLRFTCLFADPFLEPIALGLQQQLQAVGVDLKFEVVSSDKLLARINQGDFDAVLVDALSGPNLLRVYLWWHSGAPYNFGGFRSAAVDESLDMIRHAADDATYRAGVEAFQRAIVDDPPAIFLAWSSRARVVSSRFEVVPDPSGDVLKTLRLWRPAADKRVAGN